MEGKEIIHKTQKLTVLEIGTAKIVYTYKREADGYSHTVKLQSLSKENEILLCHGFMKSETPESTLALLDKYSSNVKIEIQ